MEYKDLQTYNSDCTDGSYILYFIQLKRIFLWFITQGFHKRIVGLNANTEEKLAKEMEQNMFNFTTKTQEFQVGYMGPTQPPAQWVVGLSRG